ncbi:hypothetical protein ANCCAN_14699 [Ancylostoma caninum]|uniref:Uncharacterized protein n=1 Tax=Ancylostoma caninum TaxID=29170 RepID=A0A368G4T8_ANCCA|nr:hypothetical protein ANCCAN_14699 [Ancylostoma caninum]
MASQVMNMWKVSFLRQAHHITTHLTVRFLIVSLKNYVKLNPNRTSDQLTVELILN